MKPDKIILVRHGESQGNVNKDIYKDIPDYALQLTPKGIEQAQTVGKELVNLVGGTPCQFYVSPFWRTRQTYLNIAKQFPHKEYINYYEDPRLREQEWCGKLPTTGYTHEMEAERELFGHFYYRFAEGGESCADVFDRVSDFMGTMFRDFEKDTFPRNTVIVTHGMTMRLFLMRFLHAPVEEFEKWKNPANCGYFLLERQPNDKYVLTTKMKTHVIKHNYVFPISAEDKPYFDYKPQIQYDS